MFYLGMLSFLYECCTVYGLRIAAVFRLAELLSGSANASISPPVCVCSVRAERAHKQAVSLHRAAKSSIGFSCPATATVRLLRWQFAQLRTNLHKLGRSAATRERLCINDNDTFRIDCIGIMPAKTELLPVAVLQTPCHITPYRSCPSFCHALPSHDVAVGTVIPLASVLIAGKIDTLQPPYPICGSSVVACSTGVMEIVLSAGCVFACPHPLKIPTRASANPAAYRFFMWYTSVFIVVVTV